MKDTLEAIKRQIRECYPDEVVDLSAVREIETAKTLRLIAEGGIKGDILVRLIPKVREQVWRGWTEIDRQVFWNGYIDGGADWFFRKGHPRTKAQASLFPLETTHGIYTAG